MTEKDLLECIKDRNIKLLDSYRSSCGLVRFECLVDGHIWKAYPKAILGGAGCAKCAGVLRRTQSEFVSQVAASNPNVEILGLYSNTNGRVLTKCRLCGAEWKPNARNLLLGHGCKYCANLSSVEQVTRQIGDLYPSISLISRYAGSDESATFACSVCNNTWNSSVHSILFGKGCPHCLGIVKSHEKFISEASQASPMVEVLSEYVSSYKKLKCRCRSCGFEWNKTPVSILAGTGCPKCVGRHVKFKEIKDKLHPDIKTPYSDEDFIKSKISCSCTKCGRKWETERSHAMRGTGCAKCAGLLKKTDADFKEHLKLVTDTIIPLEPYVKALHKIRFKCLKCRHEWSATPDNIQRGRGCPACKRTGFKPEKQAFFYTYVFLDYIGFGITNNFGKRNEQHQKTFAALGISAKLILLAEGYGQEVREFETSIIKSIGRVNTGVKGFIQEGAQLKHYPVLVDLLHNSSLTLKLYDDLLKAE